MSQESLTSNEGCAETPLTDLLRMIPADLRVQIPMVWANGTSNVPIGQHCYRAAAEIERLSRELAEVRLANVGLAMRDAGLPQEARAPLTKHEHLWSGVGPDAYCVGCLANRGIFGNDTPPLGEQPVEPTGCPRKGDHMTVFHRDACPYCAPQTKEGT